MPRLELNSELIQKIKTIVQKYGVTKVFIFGSVARNEASESSDLDLLVEFEQGRTLIDLIAVEQELSNALGVKVDVTTPESLHPAIKDIVLKERVQIHG